MDEFKFLKKLKDYWIENNIPNISFENADLIRNKIKLKWTKNMLEIWTANWFSTINFAFELLKTWWKITTIEFSPNSLSQAINNFKACWVDKIIKTLLWNALDIIPTLNEKYDFVFIDWMKKRSRDFLELVWDKTEDWWIIIIDDVIKFKTKMLSLYEYLEEKKIKHEIIPIDTDDWIILIIK